LIDPSCGGSPPPSICEATVSGMSTGDAASTGAHTGRGSRAQAIALTAVEVVALAGTAGDELDARQDAAIKEILLWLSRRQDRTRSG
jgi:hypothetical protein